MRNSSRQAPATRPRPLQPSATAYREISPWGRSPVQIWNGACATGIGRSGRPRMTRTVPTRLPRGSYMPTWIDRSSSGQTSIPSVRSAAVKSPWRRYASARRRRAWASNSVSVWLKRLISTGSAKVPDVSQLLGAASGGGSCSSAQLLHVCPGSVCCDRRWPMSIVRRLILLIVGDHLPPRFVTNSGDTASAETVLLAAELPDALSTGVNWRTARVGIRLPQSEVSVTEEVSNASARRCRDYA